MYRFALSLELSFDALSFDALSFSFSLSLSLSLSLAFALLPSTILLYPNWSKVMLFKEGPPHDRYMYRFALSFALSFSFSFALSFSLSLSFALPPPTLVYPN